MDSLDAINLLKEYNLFEAAQSECRKQKIDETPYDMQGHNKVYCQFLDKKRLELRKKAEMIQKASCENQVAVNSQQRPHDDCFFNRFLFVKNGFCTACSLGNELDAIEAEMAKLSEASRVLKEAAEYDYTWR